MSGTTHTNAGSYATDAWTFAGNSNYNATSGTSNDSIAKADAAIIVTPYSVTYDGAAHTATGTASGVETPTPANLASLLDLTGTTHTNAGSYATDAWTFAGNSNYNATSGTSNDSIAKADAAIVVTPYSVTYNGAAHTATGTASGVETPTPANLASLLDLTGTTHTNAGSYATDAWTFAGNSNYNATSGTSNDSIAKKTASVTPAAAGKIYGAADPTLTGTLGGFLTADGVTASYSRTAGETVGAYVISATLAPVAVLGNYDITATTASFDIAKKTASVTPAATGKIYGAADPTLTGSLSGFLAADGVTASYSRTAGETVGALRHQRDARAGGGARQLQHHILDRQLRHRGKRPRWRLRQPARFTARPTRRWPAASVASSPATP